MHDALDRGDFETVAMLGHGMRGAGGSYGFTAITDIGAALERAAASVDRDAANKWIAELSSYLDRVEVTFEAKDAARVEAALRAFLAGLPEGAVVRRQGP